MKVAEKPWLHVTAAVIRQGNKVLVSRRPEGKHLAGYWEFPGGKVKEGEDLEECLAREIREELGFNIRVLEKLATTTHEYDDRIVTLHVFECSVMKGGPKANEGQEFRWVETVDLGKYTFPPPDREVLALLSRDLKS